MYLLIDVGNTRIKWCLSYSEYDETDELHYGSLADLGNYIKTLNPARVSVLLAAVNQTLELKQLLSESGFQKIFIAQSQSSQAGVCNSYAEPGRMGVDRWLGMIAAYAKIKSSEHRGIIVVDAGSALTIDVVNSQGNHLGGYIVPGLIMAQQVLFANTERVIQYKEATSSYDQHGKLTNLGNNTVQCVESGVINQLVALVKQVKDTYSDYEIVFTGGDGELLASFIDAAAVDNNLVLKGLWQVRD